MTDACDAVTASPKGTLNTSRGEDRCTLATADQPEVNHCREKGISIGRGTKTSVEEARAAAFRAPARVKRATGGTAQDVLRALENRHRWLLFAQHCYTCSRPEDRCELGKLCTYGKKTLRHVSQCRRDDCPYPRCGLLKPLLQHSRKCQSSTCAICVPVWNYIQRDAPPQPQPEPQPETTQPQTNDSSSGLAPKQQPTQQPRPQEHTDAAAAAPDVPPASWLPLSVNSTGAPAPPAAPGHDRGAAEDPDDLLCGPRGVSPAGSSACGGTLSVRTGAGGATDADGQQLLIARATTICAPSGGNGAQGGGNRDTHISGAAGPSDDEKLRAGKQLLLQQQRQDLQQQQQQLQELQLRHASDAVQAQGRKSDQTGPLLLQQSQRPPQRQQRQQEQQQHHQQPTLLPAALGPPPPPGRFLGVASGTLSPYSLPAYGTVSLPAPVGGSPPEASERHKGVTVTATPSQPIPVLSCAAMRPPPPVGTPGQPQLLHSYPPAASLSHFYSHLQQPNSQPPPGPSVAATHWLPLSAVAASGATVATPNGAAAAAGGGGAGGILLANGATAAATATPTGPTASALWHSPGPLRAGPVALYGITADASSRPGGLVPTPGAVQTMDRYGQPYTIAGVNGSGGLQAAVGALTMAAAPLLLWQGTHPPAAPTMAGATATMAGCPQSHATAAAAAHMGSPFTIGPETARQSTGAPPVSTGCTAAAVQGLSGHGPAASAATLVPAAHPLPPHHTLVYGPAGLVPGGAATGGSIAASGGGGGGALQGPGPAESTTGAALWSYLLR